jgi:glucose-6-phosphate isomerase
MTDFSHDIAPALAAHGTLKSAFDKRLVEARAALSYWRQSGDPNFAAIRRSFAAETIEPARAIAAHLTKNATDVVLLGIGGSSLGAQTLAQVAFWGTPGYAPREGRPRLHILDNLDGATFAALLKRLDLRTTRFHVVSKSGTTTEPLMQTLAAIEALEAAGGGKYLAQHFTGETEPGANALRAILADIGAPILDHDPALGGRYSVFATGLVPALILGLDPSAFRSGARETFDAAMSGAMAVVEGAALSVAARDVGLSQSVMWPYADRLQRLPKWWRQLWAESLGKSGQGTTPIDALGPVDQHSMLQLYLDGQNDKLFTLIDAPAGDDALANSAAAKKHGLDLYAGRGMNDVVAAQVKATAETLTARGRAVRRITLTRPLDERGLGALMMHFILETLIAGRIWNIDPFGQPAVEEGKVLTRKYLGAAK